MNREPRASSRIEQIGSGVCILAAIACVLFDAPTHLARLFIAWGWA